MKHIMLDYDDFVDLTSGKVIEKDGVKIALQDIGYYNMIDIIEMNLQKSNDKG